MSILIPGMEMPKDGYIDVRLFSDGCAYIQTGEPPYYRAFKAIELPPHGDLIDRSKISYSRDVCGFRTMDFAHRAQLENVIPVIPAEEE